MVKPPCSNFRMITATYSCVQIFRIFMVHLFHYPPQLNAEGFAILVFVKIFLISIKITAVIVIFGHIIV